MPAFAAAASFVFAPKYLLTGLVIGYVAQSGRQVRVGAAVIAAFIAAMLVKSAMDRGGYDLSFGLIVSSLGYFIVGFCLIAIWAVIVFGIRHSRTAMQKPSR